MVQSVDQETNFDEMSLEEWATFNFEAADSKGKKVEEEAQASEEQTALPGAFSEDESEESKTVTVVAEASEDADSEEAGELTPPPAYQQGLEIPVAEVPIYKRPHMKAIFFGAGALLVATVAGMIFARGSNLQLGQQPTNEAKPVAEKEEKSEEELAEEKMSELEGEVAFGTLKNRAQILEEQQKQKILSGKLEEQEAEAEANQTPSNTVSLPSRPSPPSYPSSSSSSRLPLTAPPTRVVPPVIPSPSRSSRPPGSPSYSPARTPQIASAPVPPAPAPRSVGGGSPAAKVEPPSLVSFGAMPSNNRSSSSSVASSSGGFQTVAQRQMDEFGSSPNSLLAQQEQAFLSGKSQFLIEAGQSISGEVTQQIIAGQDAAFTVRSREGILGLPAGTEFVAQVTQMADGYMEAEAVAIRHVDGTESFIPQSAVRITDSGGKLLKAKSNKSFFQSGFGQAILGAGRGVADQFTSRSETFFQNDSSTTITKGAASRDLVSLGSSALKGFADPLLNQASSSSGSSALLLNPGQKVRLNINASFVVAQ